jgi:hypothetical protein
VIPQMQNHVCLLPESVSVLLHSSASQPSKIQDGDWDTDADCISSMDQGPCWDAGDMLGWGKAQGEQKLRHPEPLMMESFSMPQFTERTAWQLPARPLLCGPARLSKAGLLPQQAAAKPTGPPLHKATIPQTCQAAAHWLPGSCSTRPPSAGPPG